MSINYKNAYNNLWHSSNKLTFNEYAVKHYLKGLSAECALREIIYRNNGNLSNPHNFTYLFESAKKYEPKNLNLFKLASDVKIITILYWSQFRFQEGRKESGR